MKTLTATFLLGTLFVLATQFAKPVEKSNAFAVDKSVKYKSNVAYICFGRKLCAD